MLSKEKNEWLERRRGRQQEFVKLLHHPGEHVMGLLLTLLHYQRKLCRGHISFTASPVVRRQLWAYWTCHLSQNTGIWKQSCLTICLFEVLRQLFFTCNKWNITNIYFKGRFGARIQILESKFQLLISRMGQRNFTPICAGWRYQV